MNCDRCGVDCSNGSTMSMFNTDVLCLPCKEAERRHPAYAAAAEAEGRAVLAGDYNFKGVGCPPDLKGKP